LSGDLETEFLRRVIEVAGQRYIGDGRLRAQNKGAARQALVENGQRAFSAALKQIEHRRMAGRLSANAKETAGAEVATELLIVEDDPAQRFQPLILSVRHEFSRVLGEIGEYHAGLAQLLCPVNQHWRLAHFVDVFPVLRRALNASFEKVDENRLPVSDDQIEHQRCAVRVA